MSDIFDRPGGVDPEDEPKKEEDPLDFLGGFKKRVQSGDLPPRSKKKGQSENRGVSPLDIAGLPDEQKRILLAMLRDSEESTLAELEERFADEANLAEVLDELIDQQWLVASGDPPKYKINLQRKKSRRLSNDIWSAISDE